MPLAYVNLWKNLRKGTTASYILTGLVHQSQQNLLEESHGSLEYFFAHSRHRLKEHFSIFVLLGMLQKVGLCLRQA